MRHYDTAMRVIWVLVFVGWAVLIAALIRVVVGAFTGWGPE